MIVLGNKVRMTSTELDNYRATNGVQKAPETVEEYNAVLTKTADQWQDAAKAENDNAAAFLAAITRDARIPE